MQRFSLTLPYSFLRQLGSLHFRHEVVVVEEVRRLSTFPVVMDGWKTENRGAHGGRIGRRRTDPFLSYSSLSFLHCSFVYDDATNSNSGERERSSKLVQHNTTLNGKARWNLTGGAALAQPHSARAAHSSSPPPFPHTRSLSFHIRPSVRSARIRGKN